LFSRCTESRRYLLVRVLEYEYRVQIVGFLLQRNKYIAAKKEEILKLKAELGILSPQHAQQATDLQSKDSENKKLLSALQKAHALGETAKRELVRNSTFLFIRNPHL